MLGDFVIGVGSNLGAREQHLCAGLSAVCTLRELEPVAVSRVYETPAWGPPQPDYLNAAARVRTSLSAEALLQRLLAIELAHGRTRTLRYGPRTLDLDILWGAPHLSDTLVVPHPRLSERSFALAPLLDVAPEADELRRQLHALGGTPPCVGALWLGSGEACVRFRAEV